MIRLNMTVKEEDMNTRTQTRIFSAFLAMVMVVLLIPVGMLPISAETTASGTWGSLSWSLDSNGKLTISGTGEMNDFYDFSTEAWRAYRDSIKTVEIANGVTSIGSSAFQNCTSLTSITIPDGVTSIGKFAFSNCKSLTSITIPNSVTSIGGDAFYNCTSLTSITIPDGVTSIGENAFRYCTALTSITIPDSVTSISSYAFNGCSNLSTVCYSGSEADWAKITIGSNNSPLTNATIYYNFKIGDLNSDGYVTLVDLTILSRHLAEWADYQTINTVAADVNCDGEVTLVDITILSRYLAGWEGVTLG